MFGTDIVMADPLSQAVGLRKILAAHKQHFSHRVTNSPKEHLARQ